MKIICISDTHCQLSKIELPDGDILVCTGDITFSGNVQETEKELFELGKYRAKYKHIVLVEGNHDWLGQKNEELMDRMAEDNSITLLRDRPAVIEGIRFYGSPWQPEFCNWAFNLPRGEKLAEKWALIPKDTQVLLTHGPPHGVLDGVERFNGQLCDYEFESVGCEDLANRIKDLSDLRLHVFGHIHSGYGISRISPITYVNASSCTEQYKPINPPIVIDIDF